MRAILKWILPLCVAAVALSALAQMQICPLRPQPGTLVQNPLDLYSQNAVLSLNLTLQNQFGSDGFEHYCYVYTYQGQQVESPTLRLNPGDQLEINLTNNVQAPYGPYMQRERSRMNMVMRVSPRPGAKPGDDCNGGEVLPATTNIHFHGLNVPPVCHQDDVIYTLIQSGQSFPYDVQIPANDNPGMYWYHPHAHGTATTQVDGGAAGALFINGNIPGTQGLPERVFVIRQQFQNPNSWLPGPNQLTVNFQPAIFPERQSPFINVQYGQPEFWRIVNASTQAFLTLQLQFTAGVQQMEVVALDGVPLTSPIYQNQIILAPAERVELITPGLPNDQEGVFTTLGYDGGPTGNPNPPQQLMKIFGTNDPKYKVHPAPPPTKPPADRQRFAGLLTQQPTTTRKLYFSEQFAGSNGPSQFFITVQGQKPRVFHMDDPPAITTNIGAVEDWAIENRAGEAHDFHIHQLHFLLMAINGVPVPSPELYDSFPIPNWSGSGPYPSITVRMDFRDPQIAGTFVFHCHILDHEDAGMMEKIQVNPANNN